MKKIFILLLLICHVFAVQSKELLLSIKIQNPSSDQISFKVVTDALKGENKLYVLTLNSQNEIYTALNIDDVETITGNYNNQPFDIYVKGINKIDLKFGGNNVVKTIQFKGEGADENNLLNNLRKKYEWNDETTVFRKGLLDCHIPNQTIVAVQKASIESYFEAINNTITQQQKLLTEQKGKIQNPFISFLENEIKSINFTNKAAYFIVNQETLGTEQINRYVEIQELFKGSFIENDALLHRSTYTNAATALTYVKFLQGLSDNNREPAAFYELIQQSFSGKTRYWLHTKQFLTAHGEGYTKLAASKFSDYSQNNPNKPQVKLIRETYGNLASEMETGGLAPNFSLPNRSGEMVDLAKYKGRVIYISFWATWCKPCLASFMKTERIRLSLQDRGVVLINVSLDQDDGTWKNTMGRVPMPGINLFGGADKTLHNNYDLSKLPSYFIIGKDGKFAYLSDNPNRNILDEFDKLLAQ